MLLRRYKLQNLFHLKPSFFLIFELLPITTITLTQIKKNLKKNGFEVKFIRTKEAFGILKSQTPLLFPNHCLAPLVSRIRVSLSSCNEDSDTFFPTGITRDMSNGPLPREGNFRARGKSKKRSDILYRNDANKGSLLSSHAKTTSEPLRLGVGNLFKSNQILVYSTDYNLKTSLTHIPSTEQLVLVGFFAEGVFYHPKTLVDFASQKPQESEVVSLLNSSTNRVVFNLQHSTVSIINCLAFMALAPNF